ncbi:MAG TPA: group I intron-associated PD-(D/E)XK endonuclease [Pyrinomonadaceae bacterium]|nr:group I intron-associated PD-(D/E)XK endonuclease [Pyrinomonadaceae bacterium]
MLVFNPNKKGTLGEIAVCKELVKLGFDVFVEFGSHSKVDLVVLDEVYKAYKIQVKTTYSKSNVVEVYSTKSCLNPKYNSTYTADQIDIFAIYVIDADLVFYVTAKEILKNGKTSKFRISESKNGQKKFVRYIKDYLDFKKALRDCTPHAQTVPAVGDETVQTTTSNFSVAGESRCGK